MKVSFISKKLFILNLVIIRIFCASSVNVYKRNRVSTTEDNINTTSIKKSRNEEEILNTDGSTALQVKIYKDSYTYNQDDSFIANNFLSNYFSQTDVIFDTQESGTINRNMEVAYLPQLSNEYTEKCLPIQDIHLTLENLNETPLEDCNSAISGLPKTSHVEDTKEQTLEELLDLYLEMFIQQDYISDEIRLNQNPTEHFEFCPTKKEYSLKQISATEYEFIELEGEDLTSHIQNENESIDADTKLEIDCLNGLRNHINYLYHQNYEINKTKQIGGASMSHIGPFLNISSIFEAYIQQKTAEINNLLNYRHKNTVSHYKTKLNYTKNILYHLEFSNIDNTLGNVLFYFIDKCVTESLIFLKEIEKKIEINEEYYESFITKNIFDNNNLKILIKDSLMLTKLRDKLIYKVFLKSLVLHEHLKEIPELIVLERNKIDPACDTLVYSYFNLCLLKQLITEKKEISKIRRQFIKKLIILYIDPNESLWCQNVLDDEEIFFQYNFENRIIERCNKPHPKISYILLIICPSQKQFILNNHQRKGCFEFKVRELDYLSFILSFIVEKRIMINDWIIRNKLNKTECTLRERYIELKRMLNGPNKCYGCLFNSFYDILSTIILKTN